jgi:pentatricopeptide repeat protein
MSSYLVLCDLIFPFTFHAVCGPRGDVQGAIAAFDEGTEAGVEPDDYVTNSLLRACSRSGDGDEALKVYLAAEETLCTNEVSLSTVLCALTGGGSDKLKAAEDLVKRAEGRWPDGLLPGVCYLNLLDVAQVLCGSNHPPLSTFMTARGQVSHPLFFSIKFYLFLTLFHPSLYRPAHPRDLAPVQEAGDSEAAARAQAKFREVGGDAVAAVATFTARGKDYEVVNGDKGGGDSRLAGAGLELVEELLSHTGSVHSP